MAQNAAEHMNDQLFREGFNDFHRRSTHEKVFHQFVKEHAEELDLTNVTSCVSVGAGEGNTELVYINAAMPNLKNFYALEPNKESFRKLHQNISQMEPIGKVNNISTHFYLMGFEDWKGPPEPVDLIILSHVMYYLDEYSLVFRKCAAWLKEGGRLWLINDDTNCLSFKLSTQVFPGLIRYTKQPYPEIASEAGLNIHRASKVQYEIDYSSPTWELLQFFVNNPTERDFEKLKKSIDEYFNKSEKHIDKVDLVSFMFIK